MSGISRSLARTALLGAIALFSTAASAVPFNLTGLIVPCNAGIFGSCVKLEDGTSTSWPDPTSFDVQFDFGSQVGDVVPFEITDLAIPTASGGGTTDVTTITSSPTATGNFDVVSGVVELSFNATINRNGAGESPEFTYVMSTGTESDSCRGIGPIDIDGSDYNFGTESLALVGIGCVNVAAVGDPSDFEFMFMSLVGTITLPDPCIGGGIDTDSDGIDDSCDNCSAMFNPNQVDTDADGCGNQCDADFNQDGTVGSGDFFRLATAFGSLVPPASPNIDIGPDPLDGAVGAADFFIMGVQYGGPPGPSGTTSGTTACP